MNNNKAIKYWIDESKEALKVAWDLFDKKDYSYSLFFGHLAIEKLLKALYVKKKSSQAPYIHNLIRLAEVLELTLDDKKRTQLIKITSFNLESRYPDETRSFRKLCTSKFAKTELNKIEELYKWLLTTL